MILNKNKVEEAARKITQNNGIDFNSFTIKGEEYGINGDVNSLLISMIQFAESQLSELAIEFAKYYFYKALQIGADELDVPIHFAKELFQEFLKQRYED